MDPLRYLSALRKRWGTILVLCVAGALLATAYATAQPSLYRATSSVFVTLERGDTTSELVQGSTFTQNLVQSYVELATLPVVLEPVIERLGLDETPRSLARAVTAEVRINTVIIEVTVSNESPKLAAQTADAITASLAAAAEELSPSGADDSAAISMKPVASAEVPSNPYSPNTLFLLVTGLALGAILGVLYALGRELLDTRIGREEDLRAAPELQDIPFLASMSRRNAAAGPLVMIADPHSTEAEEYRRLCTNLEFAGVDGRIRSVAVTSALPGEGKTTTAFNLASAMGERGHRVLIVDGDLRRPALADYLNIPGARGLADVLVGSVGAEAAIQTAGGVDVLPAGTTPPNITQLITSAAMADLFREIGHHYDFVVVDCPPLLPVPDGLTFAKLTDGAILVARQRSTRRNQLVQAVESLRLVNATVLGLVLNGVQRSKSSTYGYATKGTPAPAAPDASSRPEGAPFFERTRANRPEAIGSREPELSRSAK